MLLLDFGRGYYNLSLGMSDLIHEHYYYYHNLDFIALIIIVTIWITATFSKAAHELATI